MAASVKSKIFSCNALKSAMKTCKRPTHNIFSSVAKSCEKTLNPVFLFSIERLGMTSQKNEVSFTHIFSKLTDWPVY